MQREDFILKILLYVMTLVYINFQRDDSKFSFFFLCV